MKYLFLDIDGVLNHDKWYDSKRMKELSPTFIRWEQECFDPECVQRVNRILKETGAELVVSSSWRGDPELSEIFESVGLPTDYSVTPIVDIANWVYYEHRGEEIKAFIQVFPCENYVILDDDTDFTEEQLKNHFVHCSNKDGLTEEKTNQAIKILNNE